MSDQNDATSAHAAAAAVHTLQRLGYTYHGGEQWEPPIKQEPAVRNDPQSWAHNEIPADEQGKS